MKIPGDTIKRVTGREGSITCRFTHVYPDGPCLYFTFGGLLDKRVMLDQFMEVLTTCTAATVEHGGTTTHHHAVGRFHRPFYDKQRPELFARALRGAKRELDPKGMLNPGVLIDPGGDVLSLKVTIRKEVISLSAPPKPTLPGTLSVG